VPDAWTGIRHCALAEPRAVLRPAKMIEASATPTGDETVRCHECRDCTTVRVVAEQREADKRVAAAHERARVTEPAAQIEVMRQTNDCNSSHRCPPRKLLPSPSISELHRSEGSLFARRKVQTRRSVAPAV